MSDLSASVFAHAERTNAAAAAGTEATRARGEAAEPAGAARESDDLVAGVAPDGGNAARVRAPDPEMGHCGPWSRGAEGGAGVRLHVLECAARSGRDR